jgi:hypothetical protein
MSCPQVADRGDGFHLWRVAANKFNMQLWTVGKEYPPLEEGGVGHGANTPSP